MIKQHCPKHRIFQLTCPACIEIHQGTITNDKPEPWPEGTPWRETRVVEVVTYDTHDKYQPYLYSLENGETAWIPTNYDPNGPEPSKLITR